MTSLELAVQRSSVDSSCIVSIGYSPAHQVLDVELISGDVYRYLDVPCDAYAALLAAPSLGVHFNRIVKPVQLRQADAGLKMMQ